MDVKTVGLLALFIEVQLEMEIFERMLRRRMLARIARTFPTYVVLATMLLFASISSVVATSSYAPPGVHESRAVRAEARGEYLNATSPKMQPKEIPGFSGEWNTVKNAGNKFVMTLKLSGSVMRGSYKPFDGVIKGTLIDKVLRFTWRQEDGGRGAGRFTLSSDAQSFEGTYSATDNPDDTSGGTWIGTRQQ